MAPHRRETNLHGIGDCRWPFSAHFRVWAVPGDGEPSAAGLAQFFCSALGVRDDCPVAVACFLPLGWRVFAFVGPARAKTSSPSADACWIFLGGFLLEFGFRSFLLDFCASFLVYAVVATGEASC